MLSKRVVRAAPSEGVAHLMRAIVLRGVCEGAGPRSAAEVEEAATHYERAAEPHPAPAIKANLSELLPDGVAREFSGPGCL